MRNNYDFIAPYYDFITSIVFGRNVLKSQTEFLYSLPNEGKVLFIGGGTGKALLKLVELKPKLIIDYVDASSRMIQKSKDLLKKTPHNVRFVKGTENEIPSTNYDVILTFFFLDLFQTEKRNKVFELLNHKLKPKGKWLVADFNIPNNRYNRLLETLMFLFLKFSTQIESNRIEDYPNLFTPSEFKENERREYFHNFIFSSVYQKQDGTIIG